METNKKFYIVGGKFLSFSFFYAIPFFIFFWQTVLDEILVRGKGFVRAGSIFVQPELSEFFFWRPYCQRLGHN